MNSTTQIQEIFGAIKKEELPAEAKLKAVGFFLFPLDEMITEELMTILTSFQDPGLKKKSSRLIDLSLNHSGAIKFWYESPKEYIDQYNLSLKD